MSDLAEFDVHGPVETLRTEFAEWDGGKQDWQPMMHWRSVRFRRDGLELESELHNPDGSVARVSNVYDEAGRLVEKRFQTDSKPAARHLYFYDSSGRPTRTITIDEQGEQYESETYHYDAKGRKTRTQFPPKSANKPDGNVLFTVGPGDNTVTTYYGDHDQPAEIVFHNPSHALVQREIFTRDNAGRVLKHEVRLGEGAFQLNRPEHADVFRAVLSEENGFSSTTYTYDEGGRQVERLVRMSTLTEERTTYKYNEQDSPVEETTLQSSREMQMDERGKLHPTKESSQEHHTRYTYKYDEQGNWTERVVWFQPTGSPGFERSNIERRQITYYPAAER